MRKSIPPRVWQVTLNTGGWKWPWWCHQKEKLFLRRRSKLLQFDEILRSQSFYLFNNIHWKIVTVRPGTCITKVNGFSFDFTIVPNEHLQYESQADVHHRWTLQIRIEWYERQKLKDAEKMSKRHTTYRCSENIEFLFSRLHPTTLSASCQACCTKNRDDPLGPGLT